ncbi:hypothetical protein AB0J85_21040 [Micromonospora echinofusca]|uniref:hypothetical protein n=1 Tax=Micromonospora echinofusca TaxID=47858 RepID=UPI003447881F
MTDPIELRLDRATAQDLRNALYDLGEHQAAGRAIPHMDTDMSNRLGVFLRELDIRLGGSGRFVA